MSTNNRLMLRMLWKKYCFLGCCLGWCLGFSLGGIVQIGSVDGQVERAQLGKRLQRFEVAWETATEPQRQQASDPMQVAVTRFFGMQLSSAASKLDEAWLIVRGQKSTDWEKFCLPFFVSVERQVIADPNDSLKISLTRFYDADAIKELNELDGSQNTLLLTLFAPRSIGSSNHQNDDGSDDNKVYQAQFPIAAVIDGLKIPVADVVAQLGWQRTDYQLQATLIGADQQRFDLLPQMVSFIPDWDVHLNTISSKLDDEAIDLSDTVKATLKSHQEIFRQVTAGEVQETDYPIARMLNFCESILEAPLQATQTIAAGATTNDIWLTLRRKRKQVPVRVRAPQIVPVDPAATDIQNQVDNRSLPVLVLLHGAGGSENMFFETYGAGRTVSMGLERGWLVVAPRQGFVAGVGGLAFDTPEILDELEAFFPIDRDRVFVVGHSMGAGQTIRQLSLYPHVAIAAAAIGGGSPIHQPRNPNEAKEVAWFVSAGELDFGRRGAEGLKNSLQRAEIRPENLNFKIYPGIEHMVIVQASLDDMFEFFDRQ